VNPAIQASLEDEHVRKALEASRRTERTVSGTACVKAAQLATPTLRLTTKRQTASPLRKANKCMHLRPLAHCCAHLLLAAISGCQRARTQDG
jgi:hypothetical protein